MSKKWLFAIATTMIVFMNITLPIAFGSATPGAPSSIDPPTTSVGAIPTPPAPSPVPPLTDGAGAPFAPKAPTPIPPEIPKPRLDEPIPSPIIEFGEGLSLEETGNKFPSNLPRFDIKTKKPIAWTESFLIRFVINPIFFLAGSIAIMMIIYSAARLILSRGQEEGLTAAKNTLIWASVGLGLIMVAYTLVNNLTRIIQTLI